MELNKYIDEPAYLELTICGFSHHHKDGFFSAKDAGYHNFGGLGAAKRCQRAILLPDYHEYNHFALLLHFSNADSTTVKGTPFPSLIEVTLEDLIIGFESNLFTSVDLTNVRQSYYIHTYYKEMKLTDSRHT